MSDPNPLPQSPTERLGNWMRTSTTLRLFTIVVLVLLLLIPTSMIKQVINEREDRRDEAIAEVQSKWASEQELFGPFISVPYTSTRRNSEGLMFKDDGYVNFCPENLDIQSEINPLVKKRGIFKVVLYESENDFRGNFKRPVHPASLGSVTLDWSHAFVALRIPDTRAIDNQIVLKWNDTEIPFKPGIPTQSGMYSGVHAPIDLSADSTETLTYSFSLNLDGSEELMFNPVGKTTTATMKSSWTNPSFDGAFVTDTNTVGPDGFDASWRILEFNKNIPEYWVNNSLNEDDMNFGVKLLLPVDFYQNSMRTAKYAILVIVLTFTVFFLVEVLNKKRIHPVQYVLVGLALTLFYSLLLALAEYMGFDWAYLIASVGIIGMITLYTHTIFHKHKLTFLTGIMLIIVYGFIYIILQLSDFAFLLGNLGLFVALGVVMFATRKLDWYGMRESRE